MIEIFQEWYENRHEHQRDWKKRTGGKITGFFCTDGPEVIFDAFEVLPVRVLGSRQIEDGTDSDLRRGIEIMKRARQTIKRIYELREQDDPRITRVESMYMICDQFFADAR